MPLEITIAWRIIISDGIWRAITSSQISNSFKQMTSLSSKQPDQFNSTITGHILSSMFINTISAALINGHLYDKSQI